MSIINAASRLNCKGKKELVALIDVSGEHIPSFAVLFRRFTEGAQI